MVKATLKNCWKADKPIYFFVLLLTMLFSLVYSCPAVSEINSLGLLAVEKGDLIGALGFFRLALNELNRELSILLSCRKELWHRCESCPMQHFTSNTRKVSDLSSFDQIHTTIIIFQRKFIHDLPSGSMRQRTATSQETSMDSEKSCAELNERLLALQDQGIQVPYSSSGSCFSYQPLEETKIRHAIIAFNIGLVYHLQSLRNDTKEAYRTQVLLKAYEMYHRSFILLSDTFQAYNGRHTGNLIVDLVYMATLNNLAQIIWDDFKDRQQCKLLMDLLSFVAFSSSRVLQLLDAGRGSCFGRSSDGALIDLMRRRLHLFLLNVVVFYATPVVAAPMA